MNPARSRLLGMLLVTSFVAASGGGWLLLLRQPRVANDWPGVDETVIGHFAEAAGRPEPAFAIDWIRGDLLLFAFLCAGLLAGGLLGFFGRAAFVEQRERTKSPADGDSAAGTPGASSKASSGA